MADSAWYVAKLRFLVLLESMGSEQAEESIFLFRSGDFAAAFARALELGRAAETQYVGGTGELVRWRLKEVLTLDALQAAELDGVAVYSELTSVRDDERFRFDHVFEPEASQPQRTGTV